MLLGLALLLAMLSVASFPCWRHSRRWGYLPSTTAGVLLFFVALVTVGGKPMTGGATPPRVAAAQPADQQAPQQYHAKIVDPSRAPLPLVRQGPEFARSDEMEAGPPTRVE